MLIGNGVPCFVYLTVPDEIANLHLTIDANGMVSLTPENFGKISGYMKENIKDTAKQRYDKNCSEKQSFSNFGKQDIYDIVKEIAIINSTRTAKQNIDVISTYLDANKSPFLTRLKNVDYKLVDDIANLAGMTRKEKSLASKICRFFEEWLLGTDNFTINDSVVRTMLPYYLIYNGISFNEKNDGKLDDMSYVEFVGWFNKLKVAIQKEYPSVTAHDIDALTELLTYGYPDHHGRRTCDPLDIHMPFYLIFIEYPSSPPLIIT